MLSSFFSKTKPINFVVLLVFVLCFYWGILFFSYQDWIPKNLLLKEIIAIVVLLVTTFGLNIIVRESKVTEYSSFPMFFFVLFLIIFPHVLKNEQTIICNFLLLVSLHKLLQEKTEKNATKNFFDAALWVCLASFFEDWAMLFLIPVFVAISMYDNRNIRNWLTPLVAIVATALVAIAIGLLVDQLPFLKSHFKFDFWKDLFKGFIFKLHWSQLVFVFLVITEAIIHSLRQGYLTVGKILPTRLLMLYLIVAMIVLFLNFEDGGSVLLFTFFPAAIFITNYFESISKPKWKEVFLISSISLSILLLLVKMIFFNELLL